MNSTGINFIQKLFINPLVYICIYLRYPLDIFQELLIKLEQKLNKLNYE